MLSVSWLWTHSVDLTEHSWISTVLAEAKVHSPPTSFPIQQQLQYWLMGQNWHKLSICQDYLAVFPSHCGFNHINVISQEMFSQHLFQNTSQVICLSTFIHHISHSKPGQRTRCNWIHPTPRFFNVNCHKSQLCSTKTCCRPEPHFLVSKMKLCGLSCKRSTDIIPLMLMKYQLTQWQMP